MKMFRVFSALALVGSANLCSAASLFQTTITTVQAELAEAAVGPYPSTTPRALIITPTNPSNCMGFPFAYLFQLTDLTDAVQKQLYATLVTARINGLRVTLAYVVESSNNRCRIVGVHL